MSVLCNTGGISTEMLLWCMRNKTGRAVTGTLSIVFGTVTGTNSVVVIPNAYFMLEGCFPNVQVVKISYSITLRNISMLGLTLQRNDLINDVLMNRAERSDNVLC